MPEEKVEEAIKSITEELEAQLIVLRSDGKLLEAQRLNARTRYDMEMIQEVGYCSGIENYARHLGGLAPGARPFTLIDYFPDDFLMVVDESHVTLPQIRAMYAGDQSRKGVLVNHGFRLPSALDNRPLRFEEVEKLWRSIVFVTATPADYELEQTGGEIVEQVIRPTGLVDPVIIVEPASGQVPHLLNEIKITVAKGQRVLVTALTKRLAEDLSHYIKEEGIKCAYLHSDILTIERVEILRHLRMGEYDVVVGVNLLREGLDLPEVSLVAILDADKEGFLRSKTSLIQTIGRAARNVDSRVFLYADKMTNSMQTAMDETERRRTIQTLHNEKHGITPQTIKKAIRSGFDKIVETQRKQHASGVLPDTEMLQTDELIGMLEKEMFEAAEALDFEKAATLRDQIEELSAAPVVGKMAKAPATQTRKQFKARMLKTNIRVNKKS
jgi:excinuclease ABC subunit B